MALTTRKKLLFAGLAWLMCLAPLLILELSLHAGGWTGPREVDDPFLGFSGDQKLFELSPSADQYVIKESRRGYFCPTGFRAIKADNGYRVFVIGGSTVQGRPWETETAFSSWLKLSLQVCLPEKQIEVVNCGGVSYAAYRLRFIVDEVLGYEPDLLIICTGHNEFLEQRTYRVERSVPKPIVFLHQIFSLSRSYRWLRSQVLKVRNESRPKDQLGEKVITKLDYEDGLELFEERVLQRSEVRSHFRFNLRSMLQAAQENQIPTLVLEPVANLKDCFPFKPSDDWQVGDQSDFAHSPQSTLQQILDEVSSNKTAQLNASADLYFFAGQLALQQGQTELAKSLFTRAIDHDICPLRITSALREELRNVIAGVNSSAEPNQQVLYLNLQEMCERISPDRIVGNECLVDHVHPSIATHQQIAKWITEELQKQDWVQRPTGWESTFATRVEIYQSQIDFGYYQRGRERLQSVLKWTRGQAINPIQ